MEVTTAKMEMIMAKIGVIKAKMRG